jgi:hypothetical protein
MYNRLTQQVNSIVNIPMQANPYARASDLTPDELAAFQMVRDNMGVGKGAIDAGVAAQLEALARSGRAPTQAEMDGYMNPFTENVLNRSIEKLQEDADRGFRNIGSNAALTKSFGGSRQALQEAELARNLNKNTGDLYYSGMKDNWDQALANLFSQNDRLSTNAGRAIQAGGLQQAYGLADAAALEGIGRTQRQRSDIDLGLKSEDFLRLANEPYKDLEALSMATGAISPGSIGSNSTTVTKQQQSPLQSILGLGAMAAGALTGGASTLAGAGMSGLASGVGSGMLGSMATGLGSSFGNSNLASFVTSLPAFKGWGGYTGGRVPNPMELACGGKVKKYAYGGRVGNSWSMGESADVVQSTQNPFGNEMQINRGNNPANAAMPNPVLLGTPDAGGQSFVTPTAATVQGGMVEPPRNPFQGFGQLVGKDNYNYNNNPQFQEMRQTQMDKLGFSMFPKNNLPTFGYNPGPVSPEMIMPPDQGGNPVANLLDMYKQGVRTNGSGLSPSVDTGEVPVDSVVRPPTFNRGPRGFAEGGKVTLNDSNSSEAARTFGALPGITPVNPLSVALYFAQGGQVPNSTEPQAYARGGSIKDTLFSPDGLMMLGMQILASDAPNPFAALGQAGLATLNGMQEQQVNPLDQLKLEYQQLRNQDVQGRMDDRLADNSRAEEQFAIRMGMDEARRAAQDERFYAGLDAREQRALAAEEARAARDAERNKPKFRQADYGTLPLDLREFQKLQGMKPEEVDPARLEELASTLESYASAINSDGFENEAENIYGAVENYRKNSQNRTVKGVKETLNNLGQYYNLR